MNQKIKDSINGNQTLSFIHNQAEEFLLENFKAELGALLQSSKDKKAGRRNPKLTINTDDSHSTNESIRSDSTSSTLSSGEESEISTASRGKSFFPEEPAATSFTLPKTLARNSGFTKLVTDTNETIKTSTQTILTIAASKDLRTPATLTELEAAVTSLKYSNKRLNIDTRNLKNSDGSLNKNEYVGLFGEIHYLNTKPSLNDALRSIRNLKPESRIEKLLIIGQLQYLKKHADSADKGRLNALIKEINKTLKNKTDAITTGPKIISLDNYVALVKECVTEELKANASRTRDALAATRTKAEKAWNTVKSSVLKGARRAKAFTHHLRQGNPRPTPSASSATKRALSAIEHRDLGTSQRTPRSNPLSNDAKSAATKKEALSEMPTLLRTDRILHRSRTLVDRTVLASFNLEQANAAATAKMEALKRQFTQLTGVYASKVSEFSDLTIGQRTHQALTRFYANIDKFPRLNSAIEPDGFANLLGSAMTITGYDNGLPNSFTQNSIFKELTRNSSLDAYLRHNNLTLVLSGDQGIEEAKNDIILSAGLAYGVSGSIKKEQALNFFDLLEFFDACYGDVTTQTKSSRFTGPHNLSRQPADAAKIAKLREAIATATY